MCDVHDLDVEDVCDVTGLTDMKFIELDEEDKITKMLLDEFGTGS